MATTDFISGVTPIAADWLNDVDEATYGTTSATQLRTDLAASGGSALVGHLPAGTGAVATDVQSKLREFDPKMAGVKNFESSATDLGVDDNMVLGGFGTPDPDAATKTRPAWDATVGGVAPGASDNDLGLTGHTVDATNNSALIIGGRAAYYNYVAPGASVSLTYGGDNANYHLAGMCVSMHCDLIKDDLNRGSHGAVFGGSFKQVSSDYAGSFAGQNHKVFGLHSVALGGSYIQIGALTDSTLVRRSATLGGLYSVFTAGYEGVILGGTLNTYTSGDRSAIVGGESNVMAASHAMVTGFGNTVTAQYGRAYGRGAKADIIYASARAGSYFAAQGDAQVYDITCRRTITGTTDFLAVSGGSGSDIYTPPANTSGVLELNIIAARTDVIGETAAYKLVCSFSNVSGTLTIKGQTTTLIHEDAAGYNVVAELTGTNTRVGVRCYNNASSTVRWFGSGTISIVTAA